jgi:hypothetical protein
MKFFIKVSLPHPYGGRDFLLHNIILPKGRKAPQGPSVPALTRPIFQLSVLAVDGVEGYFMNPRFNLGDAYPSMTIIGTPEESVIYVGGLFTPSPKETSELKPLLR